VHLLLLQKLVIVPSKKDLGLAFKGNQKMVVEALEVTHLMLCLLFHLQVLSLFIEAETLSLTLFLDT
jgi:hypothetical protein